MAPDMPAAVLHRGTSARQKRVVSTLAALPEAARDMEAPSIIVVGRVCALASDFAWAERLPLFGRRFLVTRPKERASRLTDKLRTLGAEVVEFPTIELRPAGCGPLRPGRQSVAGVDQSLRRPHLL